MKNIQLFVILLCGFLGFNSCELDQLDNYKAPTASLSGSFLDSVTGELIQSDIINGTQIELLETGYKNPSAYRLVVKVDGSYRNDMLFDNTYLIPPIKGGNFVPQSDTVAIHIKGQTTYDFIVQPYIRIKDASITVSGTKITAKFKLEQTVTNKVKTIGLFGHISPAVGEPIQVGKKTKALNKVTDPSEEFVLELDVRTDRDFEVGQAYYFRIGAVIDAPEAKYNYAPAVRLTIE